MQHAARLRRLCRLFLGDREEANEIVQDVFVRLQAASHGGGLVNDPGAWLTRVAINLCHDRRRAGWWPRWRRLTDGVEGARLATSEPTPEEAAIGRELADRVWQAFRRLSDRQREVFVLRRVEGWSTDDVAAALGLGAGSVKQHLFRAIQRLHAAAGDGA